MGVTIILLIEVQKVYFGSYKRLSDLVVIVEKTNDKSHWDILKTFCCFCPLTVIKILEKLTKRVNIKSEQKIIHEKNLQFDIISRQCWWNLTVWIRKINYNTAFWLKQQMSPSPSFRKTFFEQKKKWHQTLRLRN